jgi:hypothetical protein
MRTSAGTSARRPCSSKRATKRTIPVSAPSSVMFDMIVNTATAAKKTPAPWAPISRVTMTASTKVRTPETM